MCSYINCYLLTPLVYWINRNSEKDKSDKNSIYCLTSRFGMNKAIFVFTFLFTSNACSKFHVLSMYCYEIGKVAWFEIIILRSLEKGVPWKFWLDPRFPRNPKLKWILKWLPLDRGYFKFYFFFTKGESLLIILCRTYLLTRNLSFYFKSL